jgi:Cof subfamily protein (haloacid dehalogenase superfamily)
MELIVFDLDGTLLNAKGAISDYTRETLIELSKQGVAYTVATGRTLHATRNLLAGHGFRLPQVLKNGVMIWDPENDDCSHQNFLTLGEVRHVLEAVTDQRITPFIFTFEPAGRHAIYHPPLQNDIETRVANYFASGGQVDMLPASDIPANAEITNIGGIGNPDCIFRIESMIGSEPHLVAYTGTSWKGDEWHWIDIHHSRASKGGAVESLRARLGVSRIICFGDSDNDVSMFENADEAYAPENATDEVKAHATAVIGHHDQDGIARFLRQRFSIDDGG